ncbi:MAG: hypothetical protein AAEJ57_06040, partial [Opitutales bacterium]
MGLVLAFQVIAIYLLAFEVKLPLPRFALAPGLEAMRKKGIEISFASMKFTLRGMILGEGVVLRTTNKDAPALTKIDQFVVYGDPWNFLKGDIVINGFD